ncbi:hypothetical protein ACVGWC_05760, partial [Enterobacter hormaechei]
KLSHMPSTKDWSRCSMFPAQIGFFMHPGNCRLNGCGSFMYPGYQRGYRKLQVTTQLTAAQKLIYPGVYHHESNTHITMPTTTFGLTFGWSGFN